MEPLKAPAKKRAGGRARLVEDGTWKYIGCKAPPELHAAFLQLGGSEWLRGMLAREAKKLAKKTPPAG